VPHEPTRVRFGAFTVDFRSGELWRDDVRVRLQDQPLRVLQVLIEERGELVSRDSLKERLWPADVFVDFDRSLNAAMKRLRRALGDDADAPRMIETIPRRGYRFVAPVELEHQSPESDQESAPVVPQDRRGGAPRDRTRSHPLVRFAVGTVLVLAVGFGLFLSRARTSPIDSVAVLPLADMSASSGQEYFAEGMTEALIGHLGRMTNLRVISRQSVMRYRGSSLSAPAIARELDVDALVEGSVAQAGDRVRVTVQLIRANPEGHLWAETYERDMRDVLALQDEIAAAIALKIQAKIAPEHGRATRRAGPVDPEAYRAYLRGRYHYHQWPRDLDKGVASFRKAIEKDPTYAPAYAGLALCYNSLGYFRAPQEMFSEARAAAQEALRIDDTQAEGHAALGQVYLNFDWDWELAGKELRRAVALDPTSADSLDRYATYLVTLGRFDEAVAAARQALETDPLSPYANVHVGWICVNARRYDDAIVQLKEAIELDPHFTVAKEWLAWAYTLKRMDAEAAAAYAALPWKAYPFRAYFFGVSGRSADARAEISRLEELGRRQHLDPYMMAVAYAGRGDRDRAIELLSQAVDEHNAQLIALWIDPFFDTLQADPGFQELVRRVGPPPSLRASVVARRLLPRSPVRDSRPGPDPGRMQGT
jgi:TolB-like protein/DNA-binding winged helix-turn-helix (wHTH) protein/Tfp pilus assembly protein PilF